ncbi:MAG: macro domain-containing protein [bacterium]
MYTAVFNSLKSAEASGGITSIAYPAISCGIFSFPIELSAKTIFRAIKDF